MQSRFPDRRRRFLTGYYRARHPIPPREVRLMTPSEVAGVLGLDLEEVIQLVPFPEDYTEVSPMAPNLVPVEPGMPTPRVLRMIDAGG